MPGKQDLPTLVTVTHNTWETYTSRLLATVIKFVPVASYAEWIIIDNKSSDGAKLANAVRSLPIEHALKMTLVHSSTNIGDLAQYNLVIPQFVHTEKVICISTDVRIFKPTIFTLASLLDFYDMVGTPGIAIPKRAADPKIGGDWHWVPQLLIDRNLDFENTAHVQTHCFAIRKSAFLDIGGFWEPEDGNFLDKGNAITSEVYMGTQIRRAGKKLALAQIPCYHYGNGMKTREEIDEFDRTRGWDSNFVRYL